MNLRIFPTRLTRILCPRRKQEVCNKLYKTENQTCDQYYIYKYRAIDSLAIKLLSIKLLKNARTLTINCSYFWIFCVDITISDANNSSELREFNFNRNFEIRTDNKNNCEDMAKIYGHKQVNINVVDKWVH